MSEVSVVGAETASQFPNPFDWIEIWAVGGEVEQFELVGSVVPPLTMQDGMMKSGIVVGGRVKTRPFDWAPMMLS